MMTPAAYSNQCVWIIGASSGIGAALAQELASYGVRLALSARSRDALERLRESLDGEHRIFPLDVADSEAVDDNARNIKAHFGRIDRVIFLPALYIPMRLESLDLLMTRHMVDVNVLGAFYTIHAVLPLFKAQGRGQIALCASIAGYIGLPGGQPYSATKAAVMNLAESLRAECPDFIDIKVINPGFVRTPLTDKNTFKMPLIISPQEAATAIAHGLIRRGFEIHFPKRLTLLLKVLRLLPYKISLKIVRTFNR